MMTSWWTSADMLDSLDPEEDSIVSRVIQAVGLFGDILSLEDTMEPMLSQIKRGDRFGKSPDSDESAASGEDGMIKDVQEEMVMEEDKEEQVNEAELCEEEKDEGHVEEKTETEKENEAEREKNDSEVEESWEEDKTEEEEGRVESDKDEEMAIEQTLQEEGETDENTGGQDGEQREREEQEQSKDEERVEENEVMKEESGDDGAEKVKERYEAEEAQMEIGEKEEKQIMREGRNDTGVKEKEEEKVDKESKERKDKHRETVYEEVEETQQGTEKETEIQGYEELHTEKEEEVEDREEKMEGKEGNTEDKEATTERKEGVDTKQEEEAEKENKNEKVDRKEKQQEENIETVAGREENEKLWKKSSSSSPFQVLKCIETLSHDGVEPGNEAFTVLTDEETDSVAAKDQSEDIYPTSPSNNKDFEEAFLSSTDASAQVPASEIVTDTNLPSADACLHLRDPPEAPDASPAAGDDSRDTTLELHTDQLASGGRPMDEASQSLIVAGQENKEVVPTENPAMEPKEGEGDREEGGQNSPKMNSNGDDKKSSGRQSSKYKTVSYRRIRKGNTKQRIDEFEAMTNS